MKVPSDEYITQCLKIFYRFLKEKNKYTFMVDFLFNNGRDIKAFYDDVKKLYEEYNMDFSHILHMVFTLGPADKKFGFGFWNKNVKPLSDEFKLYFREHKKEIAKK